MTHAVERGSRGFPSRPLGFSPRGQRLSPSERCENQDAAIGRGTPCSLIAPVSSTKVALTTYMGANAALVQRKRDC
jgi:hypothetical protein